MSDSNEVEYERSHPMEDILDIEPGTTIATKIERTTELVVSEEYDDKDSEIEEQMQEVYDSAMGAFEGQMDEAELVEGKYKARNGEVAVQFLNTALNAAKEKSSLKQHKDKISIDKGKMSAGNASTGKIVADFNDILRSVIKGTDSDAKVIDDPKVINPDD